MEEPSGAIFPSLGSLEPVQRVAYEYAAGLATDQPIVDFGCGYGLGARLLSTATQAKVLGIDSDAQCISFARRHFASSNLAFVQRGDARLPVSDNTLGLVTVFRVLEHLPELVLKRLLEDSHRALRVGGHLVGQTPNGALPHAKPVRFTRLLSDDDLTMLATANGFSINILGQEDLGKRVPGPSQFVVSVLPLRLARTRAAKAVQGLALTWRARGVASSDPTVRIGPWDRTKNLTTFFVMTRE